MNPPSMLLRKFLKGIFLNNIEGVLLCKQIVIK